MVSKVILIGKLFNYELQYTIEGLAILRMVVRTWQGGDSQFHNVVLFDPAAEKAIRYMDIFSENPNVLLYIEGVLKYRTVEKNGSKHKTTSIVVREMRILSSFPPVRDRTQIEEIAAREDDTKEENNLEDEIV